MKRVKGPFLFPHKVSFVFIKKNRDFYARTLRMTCKDQKSVCVNKKFKRL